MFQFQNLLAKTCNLSSVRLDIFKDCIKLKLLIFKKDLLKPYLYSVALMEGSTVSLLFTGSTKVTAEVDFLWNRTVDSLKTSFHPLLWTSSGLKG